MNGRLEKELNAQTKMEQKLSNLPEIFKSYYLYLRASKKTYNTINVYISNLIHFAKFINNNNIKNDFYVNVKTENIEAYLISLETTTKHGGISRTGSDIQCVRWSSLNTFWDFLVKRNYVNENIILKTTRPKNNSEHRITFLDKKEIKRLMDAININSNDVIAIRDRTLIGLGLATGLRCSALVGINISDINFDEHYIQVIEKGSKSRKITIGEQTSKLLKEWLYIRHNMFTDINTDALFISQKKNRISTDAANDALKKYVKDAGIKKNVTMHKLRSSCACAGIAAGVSILAISEQLGHSNISITQRYVVAMQKDKEQLTNVLDNLF